MTYSFDQAEFLSDEKSPAKDDTLRVHTPLSARMRPRSLAEMVGQRHLLGEEALLPRLIRNNQISSLILYGPPGSGKTTLAEVIAKESKSRLLKLNAVLSNVAELRDVLRLASRGVKERPILFIDEIHRFNKAQQDLLLPDVEAGRVRLIGATTHKPSFYVIQPLLSRSQLFRLEALEPKEIVTVLERALLDKERGLGNTRCEVEAGVLENMAQLAAGDLRRALNILEIVVQSLPLGACIRHEALSAYAMERSIHYDRAEEGHYDTASAMIKSIRGSDPDAALYWCVKMLEGGEDPRFIARRLVILASEDIGLADSRALPLAMAAFEACERIGQPECELNLAHTVLFLATAPKSNTAYQALSKAKALLKEGPEQPVPTYLRVGYGQYAKQLACTEEYLYSHDFPEGISGQEYCKLSDPLYTPKSVGAEAAIAERLFRWKALKRSLQKTKEL